MGIEDNAKMVLIFIREKLEAVIRNSPNKNKPRMDGNIICAELRLSSSDLNEAIEFLVSNGYIEVEQNFGTAPFNFRMIKKITVLGIEYYETLTDFCEE